MEENNYISVEERLGELAFDELENMNRFEPGTKERQQCFNNALKAIEFCYENQKLQQDAYKCNLNADIEREKLEQQKEIEAERVESEQLAAFRDAEMKKAELKATYIKLGVELGIFVVSTVVTVSSLAKTAVFEETGTFRSTYSKMTQKLLDPYIRRLDAKTKN